MTLEKKIRELLALIDSDKVRLRSMVPKELRDALRVAKTRQLVGGNEIAHSEPPDEYLYLKLDGREEVVIKKRGRRSKPDEDARIVKEYDHGLEKGYWETAREY